LRIKETDGNFTFACKFILKALRIVEGDSDLSDLLPIFASPPTVPPIFGSGVKRDVLMRFNRRITLLNFSSTFLDALFPAPAADFNASSAAVNILYEVIRMGNSTSKEKVITLSAEWRNHQPESVVRRLEQKIGINRLVS
jgi:hypothetical protein